MEEKFKIITIKNNDKVIGALASKSIKNNKILELTDDKYFNYLRDILLGRIINRLNKENDRIEVIFSNNDALLLKNKLKESLEIINNKYRLDRGNKIKDAIDNNLVDELIIKHDINDCCLLREKCLLTNVSLNKENGFYVKNLLEDLIGSSTNKINIDTYFPIKGNDDIDNVMNKVIIRGKEIPDIMIVGAMEKEIASKVVEKHNNDLIKHKQLVLGGINYE